MKTKEQLEQMLWKVKSFNARTEYFQAWDAAQIELLEWILDED